MTCARSNHAPEVGAANSAAAGASGELAFMIGGALVGVWCKFAAAPELRR